MDTLTKIEELLEQARKHADKLYNKNTKNAAPKLRKVYQEIREACMDGRKEALAHQKSIGPKKSKRSAAGTDGSDDGEESSE